MILVVMLRLQRYVPPSLSLLSSLANTFPPALPAFVLPSRSPTNTYTQASDVAGHVGEESLGRHPTDDQHFQRHPHGVWALRRLLRNDLEARQP